MRDWEGEPAEQAVGGDEGAAQAQLPIDPLPETLPAPQVGQPLPRRAPELRYALIGLIFESEENLEKGLSTAKQVGNLAARVTNPLFRPLQKLGAINPAKQSFDQLALRGQSEVDRWVARGRAEETHSRALAEQATTATVDQSLSYMAQNPALEALIQQQSMSLARQILELVRRNAVSADYFFEGVARYALRRKPRYLLPAPSPEIQEQATWTLRTIRHEDL